jgi:hypothetical protein
MEGSKAATACRGTLSGGEAGANAWKIAIGRLLEQNCVFKSAFR